MLTTQFPHPTGRTTDGERTDAVPQPRQTLHRALGLANDRRHEYATLEHLLLALGDDADAATVLRACGVDVEKLKRDLTEFLDKDLAGLVKATAAATRSRPRASSASSSAPPSVQSSGRDEVTGANVLVALFLGARATRSISCNCKDMTRLDAVNFISHGIAKAPGRSSARPVQGSPPPPGEEPGTQPEREEKRRVAAAARTRCPPTA